MENLKRVVAFHDISGFSKCALTVAMPVLSAFSVEVLPVPTAVLSSNMSLPGYTFLDMTKEVDGFLTQWESLSLTADAVYTGFLASYAQTGQIKRAIGFLKPHIVVIDPVMGDGGRMYSSMDSRMAEGFLELMPYADVVAPNVTEACLLCGEKYAPDLSASKIREICLRLQSFGAKNAVVTGIKRNGLIYNCILEKGEYSEIGIKELPINIGGTGDLFASCVTGKLINGAGLHSAVEFASDFVWRAMAITLKTRDYKRRGICFEPLLRNFKGNLVPANR